jgi:hypothetical protein
MPTVVAMLAHFGASAVAVMLTVPDHHSLCTGQRRRRNRERTESGNDISKFLHDVLLQSNANLNGAFV